VNSLHNQGIDVPAPGLAVDGVAPDGTIEAVRVIATPAGPVRGFAIGVQWHPEYDWPTDPVSRRIFERFGAAIRAYVDESRLGILPAAAAAD
jgi:putative glutamine amidotransferase